jgi:ankyrin repeat protein
MHSDSLLDKRTPKEIKSTLSNLPKGSVALDEAYREAIHRIEGQLSGDCERAKRVLSFITHAERPLTMSELCCALAVEPGAVDLDPENVPEVDDLVSVCAGLVVIDEESEIVRLVHYTTQEYFERVGKHWMPDAQYNIASACITYLSFDAFKGGACPTDEEFEQRTREYEFLEYAANYWGNHVLPVQSEVCEQACGFLQHEGLLMCTKQASKPRISSIRGYSQSYDQQATGLHVAASFRLHGLAQELIARAGPGAMATLNAGNVLQQSPLHVAALNGHVEAVRLLLYMAASIPKPDGQLPGKDYIHITDRARWTALSWAAVRGHVDVVRILIEKGALGGADMLAKGVFPLYVAATRNDKEVFQLLVSHGVTPDLQDERGESSLAKAANQGLDTTLETMLSVPGVDVNTRDSYGRSVLWWAASGGDVATVKLLLEKYHADPYIADNFGRTPLTMALVKRAEEVVELLSSICEDDHLGDADWKGLMARVFRSNVLYVGCEVCGMYTVDHWHCASCAEGDFDVCLQCFEKGARCLSEAHELFRRVERCGKWVKVETAPDAIAAGESSSIGSFDVTMR